MAKSIDFRIKDKVILVIGGASGIGIELVKGCLEREAKGVAIFDINDHGGKKQAEELQEKYSKDKVCFIHADITNKFQLDSAFSATAMLFKNLDVVINTVGVFNDAQWRSEVLITMNGSIHGILFGLHYIKKYKSGDSGLIITFSGISALQNCPSVPIYSAVKFGVVGLGRTFGHEAYYTHSKVRVITIVPGLTESPVLLDFNAQCLSPVYARMNADYIRNDTIQSVAYLVNSTFDIINKGTTGSVWVVKDNEFCYDYEFQDISL